MLLKCPHEVRYSQTNAFCQITDHSFRKFLILESHQPKLSTFLIKLKLVLCAYCLTTRLVTEPFNPLIFKKYMPLVQFSMETSLVMVKILRTGLGNNAILFANS